ncbi:MAG: LLM class F420-dependent oxidoreductase [Acidimicrobiales bacterium]
MQIGVVLPQTEMGGDRGALRSYAQAVEEAGYAHILAYDHVLGADPAVHEGWAGPYDHRSTFHEPLVAFGFLAAVCSLELVTGIIILPQRQTALVAKQAAEVDLLTGGRFRLGIGLGWNAVEYEALGEDFSTRGRRVEEQIELLRRLWTQTVVSFEGTDHTVTGAGLAPMPIQRPIPVWMGASSEPALRRAGRLADGWIPLTGTGEGLERAVAAVRQGAQEAEREYDTMGMEGRIGVKAGELDAAARRAQRWEEAGATHLCVNTMGGGFEGIDAHISALVEVAQVLGLKGPAAAADRSVVSGPAGGGTR